MKFRLTLAMLLAGCLAACEDGKPIVLQSEIHLNPSGKLAVVLEEVDNGMGFGQGALYREVHIVNAGETPEAHGDPSKTVVFYAESTYGKGKDVTVEWLSEGNLRIRYDAIQRPGRQLRSYRGVSVDIGPYIESAR